MDEILVEPQDFLLIASSLQEPGIGPDFDHTFGAGNLRRSKTRGIRRSLRADNESGLT